MSGEEDELINLKQFLEERIALIREDYFVRNKNVHESIKADLDLPEETFNKLQNMCNPKLFNPEESQREISSIEDFDSENLSFVEYLKNIYTRPNKRNQPVEIRFLKNLAKLNELEPENEDQIQAPDIILSVQLSQPLNSKLRKLAWSEDFLVLGQNYLCELKDKITCHRDEIRIGEFSEDPESVKSAPSMKDFIKSGYFFIENCLYNDMRNENNDISEVVRKWGEEKKIGTFESKTMENTKFIDLNIKIGFPYLYTHLGNCEHLLIFTSVKLVNPSSDCYLKSKYPILKDKTRGRFTFCWCCNKIYAKWIVCNSKYAVDDPTFLCERCLKNTHYLLAEKTDEENMEVNEEQEENEEKLKKAFDFKVYHYSQI
ncbi:unnamed protein product [Brachionus calyciflorus]|uniref:snRNA-activating protein complex subunit 3 n=1 Tax=Brachionus calyciflorus TaxID=104777 RepID=A0A813VY77_9BILA|nr:unnamed protein product [Brachionus calyciflorus]